MFLSAVLYSYSDGTHSLHRIHCWASDVMQISPNLFWWKKKLLCIILDSLRVSTFSANIHCWVNYSFNNGLRVSKWSQNSFMNYPFKTQIVSPTHSQFLIEDNFSLWTIIPGVVTCLVAVFCLLLSHLSMWQHRECETVLRTVSWLNQLEKVCYTCLLREFCVR